MGNTRAKQMLNIICSVTLPYHEVTYTSNAHFMIDKEGPFDSILEWYKGAVPHYLDSSRLEAKQKPLIDYSLFFGLFLLATLVADKEIRVSVSKEHIYISPLVEEEASNFKANKEAFKLFKKHHIDAEEFYSAYSKNLSLGRLYFDKELRIARLKCPLIKNGLYLGYEDQILTIKEKAVVDILRQTHPLSCNEISKQLNLNSRSVRYTVNKLVKKKILTPSSKFKTSPLQTYAPAKFSL